MAGNSVDSYESSSPSKARKGNASPYGNTTPTKKFMPPPRLVDGID